jgi:uncharacterized membrane protein
VTPDWAPNLHPLVVHFPIALWMTAVAFDLIGWLLPHRNRMGWLPPALYLGGAVSALTAYLTGREAASTVLLPGMAHRIVAQHWQWALATTWYFIAFALVRVVFAVRPRMALSGGVRSTLLAGALIGAVLLYGTAERGGRLVYEQRVGVAAR